MKYNEVKLAQDKMMEAIRLSRATVFNFLNSCIIDAGFLDKTVVVKKTREKGVLMVCENAYTFSPYVIKFFPLKKDGLVSHKASLISDLSFYEIMSDRCVEHLKSVFELYEKN